MANIVAQAPKQMSKDQDDLERQIQKYTRRARVEFYFHGANAFEAHKTIVNFAMELCKELNLNISSGTTAFYEDPVVGENKK